MSRRKAFDPDAALDRASELFCQHGYHGASITKLLAAMQLSRQSLYDTFGDKHSLYLACLRHHRGYLRSLYTQVFAEQRSASTRLEALFGFVDGTVAPAPARRSCLMASAALELGQRDLAVLEVIADHLRELENTLFRIVIEGQAAGELDREQDARSLARFLTNALHGRGVLSRGGASAPTLRDAVTTTLAVVQRTPGRRPQPYPAPTRPVAQA